MKEFTTCISTGNCRSVQRTQSEIEESLEIVSGVSHESFIYDAFSFVAPDLSADFDRKEIPSMMLDETLIGTSSLSCFELDGQLIGGVVVSIPWDEDASMEQARSVYEKYRTGFGGRLLETVSSRGVNTREVAAEVSAADIGLDELDIQLVNPESDVETRNGVSSQSFGFVSDSTLNYLYLLSGGAAHREDDFKTVVRQLDTVSVFSNPLTSNGSGSVFVPCSLVLSAPSIQSYQESTQELSQSVQVNIGSMNNPQVFIDSTLEFDFVSDVGSGVSVEIIGSRNAPQIEGQFRTGIEDGREIDEGGYEALTNGLYGSPAASDEASVFVGGVSPSWACACETSVCQTTVLAMTRGEFSQSQLAKLDDLLQQVEGREPIEVTVDGVRVRHS